MCKHQYEKVGTRTYSSYVPDYAQGAYFPEDEPGIYCELYGYLCGNLDGKDPEDCPLYEELEELCPDCGENLSIDGHGIVCPYCMKRFD